MQFLRRRAKPHIPSRQLTPKRRHPSLQFLRRNHQPNRSNPPPGHHKQRHSLGPHKILQRKRSRPRNTRPLHRRCLPGPPAWPDRPAFRWSPLPGAREYRIDIVDQNFNSLATGTTTATEWTPPVPLPRGQILQWQVRARERIAPAPPQPDAKFRILTAPEAATWQQRQDETATDPAARARAAAALGLRQEALRLLPASDPLAQSLNW